MNEKRYSKVLEKVKSYDKINEFNDIMDDYFEELEMHHPNIYNNLIKEIDKLNVKINIFDEKELDKYLKLIHHKDMPSLWKTGDTSKVANDIGIDFKKWKFNPYTFNFVMNMMRADYYAEFKKMFSTSPLMKQAILDSPSFYAHLAKAWLEDEDAPPDKALKYIHILMDEKEI